MNGDVCSGGRRRSQRAANAQATVITMNQQLSYGQSDRREARGDFDGLELPMRTSSCDRGSTEDKPQHLFGERSRGFGRVSGGLRNVSVRLNKIAVSDFERLGDVSQSLR